MHYVTPSSATLDSLEFTLFKAALFIIFAVNLWKFVRKEVRKGYGGAYGSRGSATVKQARRKRQ